MTAASQAMNFTFLYALCLSEWLQQHVKACFTHQGHNFTPVGTGWSLSCTRLRPNSQRQSSLNPKASLDPQTEQQNGHFGQTDLGAALLPPPHTQSPRAGTVLPAGKLQTPEELEGRQVGAWGSCSWILEPKHPEVFFISLIWPYSFWKQGYNLLFLRSKQENRTVGRPTAGLLMSQSFQYVHYSVATDSYIW